MTEPVISKAEQLEDWLTIWQSELAGLLVDREMQEAGLRHIASWAAHSRAAFWATDGCRDGPERSTGAAAPTGATPVDDAFDGRDAVIARLLERVDDLERVLGRAGGSVGGGSGGTRR